MKKNKILNVILLSLLSLLFSTGLLFADNPVISDQNADIADPEILYINGRFWIYPTYVPSKDWLSTNFKCWSSTNLVDWVDEEQVINKNIEELRRKSEKIILWIDEGDITPGDLYIALLRVIFNMRDAFGRTYPYRPTNYQDSFHRAFILADPTALGRLYLKGRGIGITAAFSCDALMFALLHPWTEIPVAAPTIKQASRPIWWANWLADNCNFPDLFARNQKIKTECHLKNGSRITLIPGHSVHAPRSIRAGVMFIDEFEFLPYQKELRSGMRGSLVKGGQETIVSTAYSTASEFWRLVQDPEFYGFRFFRTPCFDRIDPHIPILKQAYELAAFWLDVKKMEEDRRTDPVDFMREYMCDPQEMAAAVLTWDLLTNYLCKLKPLVQTKHLWAVETKRKTSGIYGLGIDFGSEAHMAGYSVIKQIMSKEGWLMYYQVYTELKEKYKTQEQEQFVKDLHKRFKFNFVVIDKTGPGLGLFHLLEERLPTRVDGIHYASNAPDSHEPITAEMAYCLRNVALDKRILLLDDHDIKVDMSSVQLADLKARTYRQAGDTAKRHGEIFWATAQVVWMIERALGRQPGMELVEWRHTLSRPDIEFLKKIGLPIKPDDYSDYEVL